MVMRTVERTAAPILRHGDGFDWGEELIHWAEARNVGVVEILEAHRIAEGWVQLRVVLGLGAEQYAAEVGA
jgi:hypothetical protein